jgi:hypothetical protein
MDKGTALTPVLTNITSAQLNKSDLLELVEAEEETRIQKEIKDLQKELDDNRTQCNKIGDELSKAGEKEWRSKFDEIAKIMGGKVEETIAEVHRYNKWSHYVDKRGNSKKISDKPVTILKVVGICSGKDRLFRTEIEVDIGNNEKVSELHTREQQVKDKLDALRVEEQTLKSRMKKVSAGITRKCLESNEQGKTILSLLAKIKSTALQMTIDKAQKEQYQQNNYILCTNKNKNEDDE